MRSVPYGQFTMGYESYGENHQVTLNTPTLTKPKIINTAYKRCVDAGKCLPPIANLKDFYENSEFTITL